jgi:hypothetical protein
MEHYGDLGYKVSDVGSVESFDVRAVKGADELHIEVKGSLSIVDHVELTRNEVKHARRERTDLVVVDEIRWERLDDGTVRTSGGRARTWRAWEPADEHLRPDRYRYRLPD